MYISVLFFIRLLILHYQYNYFVKPFFSSYFGPMMSISILCCSSCCKRGSSYCKLGSSYCKLGSSYYKSAPPTSNSGPPTVNSSPPSVKVYSRRSLVNSRRSRVYSRRSMLTVGGTPKHGRVSPLGAFIFSICVSYNLSEKTGPKINTETLWTSWAQKMKKKLCYKIIVLILKDE